jgi:hypothetical protein
MTATTGTTETTDPGALDDLLRQVRTLTDRAAVVDLLDRFFRDLDERTAADRPFDVDWVRSYFTDDARVEYPVGAAQGVDDIAGRIAVGMGGFQRAQHITTNYVVDLDGDRATVRCNLLATHVHTEAARRRRGMAPGARFTVGDYYDNELLRTPAGWRIARQVLHVTWIEGLPPDIPA